MRRALLLTTATLAIAVLFAAAAHADASPSLPVITARAASHAAHVSGNEVTWRSTYAWDELDPSVGLVRLDLARPLTAQLDSGASPGVTAVHDASGALVALVIDTDRLPARRRAIDIALRAAIGHDGADMLLDAPLAQGDAVQRVDVVGDDDRRFEPSPSLGLVHNVGFWSAPGVSSAGRHLCDDAAGVHEVPVDDAPIYLQGTSTSADHALRGRVLTGAERARPGKVFAILAFVVLALALAGIYPWLGRHAAIEQAEAVLREEYEQAARRPRRRT